MVAAHVSRGVSAHQRRSERPLEPFERVMWPAACRYGVPSQVWRSKVAWPAEVRPHGQPLRLRRVTVSDFSIL